MGDEASGMGEGLLPIEPLPLTETPSNPKDEKHTPSGSRNTSHVGLSHHSPAWWLHRIQKYSSYVFSAFAVAHITNTSIIPLVTRSVPASESYLLLTRPYYQGIPAEPLLIAIPLWSHVVSGVALRLYRRHQTARRFGDYPSSSSSSSSSALAKLRSFFSPRFWPAVSGISQLGFPFVPLLVGHVFVNRWIPDRFPGGASNVNLGYVSHAFARHPAVSSAGFAALVGVGTFHIVWGWAKWWGFTPAQVTDAGPRRDLVRTRRWYIVNAVAAAVTGLWLAGALGVIAKGGEAPGWVGKQYDEMYRAIPVLGRWM